MLVLGLSTLAESSQPSLVLASERRAITIYRTAEPETLTRREAPAQYRWARRRGNACVDRFLRINEITTAFLAAIRPIGASLSPSLPRIRKSSQDHHPRRFVRTHASSDSRSPCRRAQMEKKGIHGSTAIVADHSFNARLTIIAQVPF
ncbi:hypothetical protein Q7P37_005311 [Cladosporium fusiforme]